MAKWEIINEEDLSFAFPQKYFRHELYFPLTNTQGKIFSSLSPYLSGDIKRNRHQFLTYPATVFDLNNFSHTRNVWFYFGKNNIFSLSPLIPTADKIEIRAGALWHKFIRINRKNQLKIDVLNFVPENMPLEIMQIEVENLSGKTKNFSLTTALPLFCRSEDNLRDHRHVTSLLNRIEISPFGLLVKPTMHFDERGHKKNETAYFFFAYQDNNKKPAGFFPTQEEFLGANGSWLKPKSVFSDQKPHCRNNARFQGKEAMGAAKFEKIMLPPGKKTCFCLIYGISQAKEDPFKYFSRLNRKNKVAQEFRKSQKAWQEIHSRIEIKTGQKETDFLLKWISLQPVLRKLFGCSFLPHFDYGKGGRGWRDLWQDIFLLLLSRPQNLRDTIKNNFAGVRIDGTNATIISQEGKFISDRNNIARVWSDHGVWPYLTLKLYLDQTKDYQLLFEKAAYFQDHLRQRAKLILPPPAKNLLREQSGKVYRASILEHLLIQNVIGFFNVGKHLNTLLEDADWNDALDMAKHKGESVAFSSMYAENLNLIAQDLEYLKENKGLGEIEVLEEFSPLLTAKLNYNSYPARRKMLAEYLEKVKNRVSGKKTKLKVDLVIKSLREKSQWAKSHIRKTGWDKKARIFNGYYDDYGRKVEGKQNNSSSILLPSQTFIMLSDTATSKQAADIYQTLKKQLKDKQYHLFRLNTDFGKLRLDLGRAFGFSYGEKENGSYFSHMNVMLAAAFIKKGLIKEGEAIIASLLKICRQEGNPFYPNLPEYFNQEKKGLYFYLTGSASWLMLVILREILGIKPQRGDLFIKPQFTTKLFPHSLVKAKLSAGRKQITVIYHNPRKKSWPSYSLAAATLNQKPLPVSSDSLLIPYSKLTALKEKEAKIDIYLK